MPAIWRWAIFECRLNAESPRVDFMACVADVDDDRQALAGALRSLPAHSFGGAVQLLSAWTAGDTPLSAVPIIWLEWDIVDGAPAPPLSSLCLDRSFLRPGLGPPDRRLQAELIHSFLADIAGDRALAAQVDCGLATCLRELPEDACLLHAAPLLARGLPRIRITLGLQPGSMLQWLEAIGWPGDLGEVAAWLKMMVMPWQKVFFQVELDHRLHPHLSVETRISSEGFPEREHWRAFLDRCVDAELVDRTRAGAALRWPGESVLMTRDITMTLKRSAYLKLVLTGGRASEVKAYVGCSRVS
jgi:hypothetical protein